MEATQRFAARPRTRPPTLSWLGGASTRHRRWPRPQPRPRPRPRISGPFLHRSKRHGSLTLPKSGRGRRNPLGDFRSSARPFPHLPGRHVLQKKRERAEERTRGRRHGVGTRSGGSRSRRTNRRGVLRRRVECRPRDRSLPRDRYAHERADSGSELRFQSRPKASAGISASSEEREPWAEAFSLPAFEEKCPEQSLAWYDTYCHARPRPAGSHSHRCAAVIGGFQERFRTEALRWRRRRIIRWKNPW